MLPLDKSTLQGIWSTILLPYCENGDIDWENIQLQLQALKRSGVSGIYFNGTAGEFFSQTDEEYSRLLGTVSRFCDEHSIPYQAGASHAHPAGTLKRVAEAQSQHPGAIQVILPEWISLNWDEIIQYFLRVAQEAYPVPLVVYNPPNAKRVLTPPEWLSLAKSVRGIIGIKVLGGDALWYKEMEPASEFLSIFVAGTRLATGLIKGCATGSYSNVACFSPRGAVDWHRIMLEDPQRALNHEAIIQNAFNEALGPYRGKYSHTAMDKALACAGKWGPKSPTVRWPLASFSMKEVEGISSVLNQHLDFTKTIL